MAAPKRAAGPELTGPNGIPAAAGTNGTDYPDRVSVGAYKRLTGDTAPLGCHEFAIAAIERRHGGDLLALIGELVLRTLTNEGGR